MKILSRLLVVVVVLLVPYVSCGQDAESRSECVVTGRHKKADVKAIEDWCKRYTDAVEANDLARYRTFWSEDVIWMPPGERMIQGIDACMDHHRPAFQELNQQEEFFVKEIKFGEDFTAVRLDYTYKGVPKPGSDLEPVEEVGKAIFLMRRKADRSWIATHCIWNLDTPRE